MGANKSNPRGRVDSNVQYLNNFSYNRGSITGSLATNFAERQLTSTFDLNHRGKLAFDSLADFLAGNITGGGNQTEGDSRRHTYQNNFGVLPSGQLSLVAPTHS